MRQYKLTQWYTAEKNLILVSTETMMWKPVSVWSIVLHAQCMPLSSVSKIEAAVHLQVG